MKISKKIIANLKEGGVDFYLSVPCKLLANMIDILAVSYTHLTLPTTPYV